MSTLVLCPSTAYDYALSAPSPAILVDTMAELVESVHLQYLNYFTRLST